MTLLARKLEVVLQLQPELQPELQPAPLPLPPEEIPETEEGPGRVDRLFALIAIYNVLVRANTKRMLDRTSLEGTDYFGR